MRAGIIGAFSLLALLGCDSGSGSDAPPPRRITASDVTTVPPGTAVGSYFAGDYSITSGQVEACSCRVGNCATIHVVVGTVLTVTQTDGMIQIGDPSSTEVCAGGVDSDGSFHCTGEVMQTDALTFVVASGQFEFANSAVSALHQTEEISATLPTIDCDIRVYMSAQFIGPAAVETNVGP